MFLKTCKNLDLPSESIPVLEKAFRLVTENDDTGMLFQQAIDSILTPNNIKFDEATSKILEITAINQYTLNMVLCISCLEPLNKIYENTELKDNFYRRVKSLKEQLISCKEQYNIWGITEAFWQWFFHEWQCAELGRLEFEPFYHFCDVPYKGIKKGAPVILIHIPGNSPLDMDKVMDSLKLAYNHFKDRFESGIVPFITHTWLLYPPYLNGVFKEGGNLMKFAELFDIIDQNESEYGNFFNIFGCNYPGEDLSNVPQKTSLQRNMLKYIKDGNKMGQGYGIFLYDGNGIVKDN